MSLIKEVENIARSLGEKILQLRDNGPIDGIWIGNQLKTDADMMAHQFLAHELPKIKDDIPVISEESDLGKDGKRPDVYWLIDPIDGTASYANGFDGFTIHISLMDNLKATMAVVYAPALNEMFTAELGLGAYCNDKPLHIIKNKKIRSLIDNYPEPRGTAEYLCNELGIESYIECGGIGLKICRVADNSADLFVKTVPVRDWDVAAPELILKEAGGELFTSDGSEFLYRDSYEKFGIIAGPSKESVEEIILLVNKVL